MVDVCKMINFPPMNFFEQHLLPDEIPQNYDYEYSRFFYIRAEATTDDDNLIETFDAYMLQDPFPPGKPGTPKTSRTWEEVTESALRGHSAVPPTPFDFDVWAESRVILFLEQPFWEFSPRLAALTTKYNYDGQYFDLRRHAIIDDNFVNVPDALWQRDWSEYPSHCISFYTREPCRDWQLPGGSEKVKHGFSLNLEVPMAGGSRLPLTIDPDIENKGGHP